MQMNWYEQFFRGLALEYLFHDKRPERTGHDFRKGDEANLNEKSP